MIKEKKWYKIQKQPVPTFLDLDKSPRTLRRGKRLPPRRLDPLRLS